jgi:hypothetical protein
MGVGEGAGQAALPDQWFLETVMGIPKEKRDIFLAAVAARAGEGEAKTLFQAMAERMGRTSTEIVRASNATARLTKLDQLARHVAVNGAVSGLPDEFGFSPDEHLTGYLVSREAADRADKSKVPAIGSDEFKALSPEQQTELERIEEEREFVLLYKKVNDIATGAIDPAKGSNYYASGLIGVAGMLPNLGLMAMGPAGMAVNARGYISQRTLDHAAANPGVDTRDSIAIGTAQGIGETMLDVIPWKVLSGRTPLLAKWLKKPTLTRSGIIGRGAARLTGGTILEGATEFGQEVIVPSAVEELAQILKAELPEANWDARLEGFTSEESLSEVIPSIVMLSFLGVGVGSIRDYKGGWQLVGNRDLLIGAKLTEAEADAVVEAARREDAETAQDLLRKAFVRIDEKRDITGVMPEAARTALKNVQAEVEARIIAEEKGEVSGIIPKYGRNTDGQHYLRFQDGTTRTYGTAAEASQARWEYAEEKRIDELSEFRSAITMSERGALPGQEFDFEFENRKDDLQQAKARGEVSEAGVQNRLNQANRLDGQVTTEQEVTQDLDPTETDIENEYQKKWTAAELQATRLDDQAAAAQILGSSRIEYVGEVTRFVIRLKQGATPLTVFEEKIEGDAKVTLKKKGGRDWMLTRLRDYERFSGDVMLPESDADVTTKDLVEAWSHFGISYLTGKTRKSERGEGYEDVGRAGIQRMMANAKRAGLAVAGEGYTEFFRAVLKRAAKINKMRREGKLDVDMEREIARSLGISEQFEYEQKAIEEGQKFKQEIDPDGVLNEGEENGQTAGQDETTFSVIRTSSSDGQSVTTENPVLTSIAGVSAADIFQSAKKRHGVTRSIYEAGYVLPDGTLLDFSGRADAGGFKQLKDLTFVAESGRDYMRDQRQVDHRDIEWEGMPQAREQSDGMLDFLRLGAIRIDANSGMISMHSRAKPSGAQLSVLKALVVGADGAYMDLEDDSGVRASIQLEGGKFAKVQGLINRWASGENPEYEGVSFSVMASQDAEYLNLAADPEANQARLQEMVDEAAKAAGYAERAYHGSPSKPFWVFDPTRKGERTGSNSALLGFFASSARDVASQYRFTQQERASAGYTGPLGFNLEDAEAMVERAEMIEAWAEFDADEDGWIGRNKAWDKWGSEYDYNSDNVVYESKEEAEEAAENERDAEISKSQKLLDEKVAEYKAIADERESQGTLHDLFIKLENPLVYDFKGGSFKDKSYSELVQEAIDEGYDGVIMENTNDSIDDDTKSDVFVFFKSSQAKLADPVTYDESGNVIPLSERFNPEKDSISFSVISSKFLRDDPRFEALKQDGRIETGVDVEKFTGMHAMLHSPDTAFSGDLSFGDETIISGKGGAYYPLLFADDNYFWASTKNKAKDTAKNLNLISKKNGGKAVMALLSAPVEKMFSSTTMSTGVIDFFYRMSKSPRRSGINRTNLNAILVKASRVVSSKGKSFNLNLSSKGSLEDNINALREALQPTASSFDLRKTFVESVASQVAEAVKSIDQAQYLSGILLSDDNRFAKSAIRKGKLSKASIMQALGHHLTEPFLRDFQEYANGAIYSIIEVDGEVEAVRSDRHESYPFAIVPKNKDAKVKVSVLEKAYDWQSIVGRDSGEYSSAEERFSLMPTGGMSVTSLKFLGPRESDAPVRSGLSFSVITNAQDSDLRSTGINVRSDTKNLRYADLLVDGKKLYETRDTNSLKAFIGKTVSIVRTGEGKAKAIGSVKIGEPIEVDESQFRELQDKHLVPPGSTFDIKQGGTKFLYPVTESERYLSELDVSNDGNIFTSRQVIGASPEADSTTFSVITNAESRIAESFNPFLRNPEKRLKIVLEAQRRAAEKARGFQEIIRLNRSGADIERERLTREADLMGEKLDTLSPSEIGALEAMGTLDDIGMRPILSDLLREKYYKTKSGKSVKYWRGSLMSKSAAERQGIDTKGGEWDGIPEGLPPYVWGGSVMPDQAASQFGFETTDEFWTALSAEVASYQNLKADTKAAMTRIRDLEKEAKAESKAWADEQKRLRKTVGTDRATLIAAMRTLDAMISALPSEIRGKIGGMVRLAQFKGPGAMLDELERRANRLDVELERWLKKEADKGVKKLFERAKPAKDESGKKRVGKAGADIHDLFETARMAWKNWDAEKAEAHAVGIEAEVAKGELSPEWEAHKLLEAELVRSFGGWNQADSVRKNHALETATEIWDRAYLEYREKKAKEKERRDGIRADLRADTGKAGKKSERSLAEMAGVKLPGRARDFFLSLLNFEQLTQWAFGKESKWAQWFADEQRKAENAKLDAVQAVTEGVEDLFTELAGGNRFKGEQLQFRMMQRSIEATAADGDIVPLSELEAISALLMWQQEDGKRHLRGKRDENGAITSDWAYDEDFINEISGKLSPEAWRVLGYLQQEYGKEYGPLNEVYRDIYGINLPQNANYSPLTVKPTQAAAGQTADPLTGSTVSTGSFTPGSLRSRAQVSAEPDFRDAVATFIAHKKQIEHWKAHARFVLDANAVLGNREVGNSIEAAHGQEAVKIIRKWLDAIAQGGVRDASAGTAIRGFFDRITGNAASMALVGRIGTLGVQATQLGAAAALMPTGAYVVRLGKLLSGNLGWGAALDSAYIKRRLDQQPIMVQAAMQGLKAGKPSQIKHQVSKIGSLLNGADALFTAGTYAIVYDYHFKEAMRGGMDSEGAAKYATETAERVVESVAQPTRLGTRSFLEVSSSNPFMRLAWAFASDARKNVGLMGMAYTKGNLTDKYRATIFVVLLNGLLAGVIRSAWRDLRDDEDDEIFDEKYWSVKRLALSTSTDWLVGFPVIGEEVQRAIMNMSGEYTPDGGLLSSLSEAPAAAMNIIEGDSTNYLRDIEKLMTAIGLFSDNTAAATSVMHLVRDIYGLGENFLGGD